MAQRYGFRYVAVDRFTSETRAVTDFIGNQPTEWCSAKPAKITVRPPGHQSHGYSSETGLIVFSSIAGCEGQRCVRTDD